MSNINDRFVKSVPTPKKRLIYWDDKITGFGVRVTKNGTKSFTLRYVLKGKERKYVIGKFPELSTSAAKEIAIKLKGEIVQGFDPLETRIAIRLTPTFKELAEEFLGAKKNFYRPATLNSYKKYHLAKCLLPAFGNKKIDHISKKDIERFIASLHETPTYANRILTLLSSIFNTAISWDLLEKNPAKGVKKYTEHRREEYLSEEQIKKVIDVLNNETSKLNVAVIKLILATGSRKGEVLSARWEDFDFAKQIWIKPHTLTKQNKTSIIPLNSEALDVLLDMKNNIVTDESEIKKGPADESHTISNETYLFYNPKTKTHIKDIKRFWIEVRNKSGVPNIRIHDLRHTFASILINKGVGLEVIGKLVGHSNIKTTQRYAHLVNDVLKQASEMVGDVMR